MTGKSANFSRRLDNARGICHNMPMKICLIHGSATPETEKAKAGLLARYPSAEVKEWRLPKDMPAFCTGCGECVRKGETLCRDARYYMPVWKSMESADLIAFVYPELSRGAPASVVVLLDHLRWATVEHRPRPSMFRKLAVILVAGNGRGAFSPVREMLTAFGIRGVTCATVGEGARPYVIPSAPPRAGFLYKRAYAAMLKRSAPARSALDVKWWEEHPELVRPWAE